MATGPSFVVMVMQVGRSDIVRTSCRPKCSFPVSVSMDYSRPRSCSLIRILNEVNLPYYATPHLHNCQNDVMLKMSTISHPPDAVMANSDGTFLCSCFLHSASYCRHTPLVSTLLTSHAISGGRRAQEAQHQRDVWRRRLGRVWR